MRESAGSAHIPYDVLKRGSPSPPIIDGADYAFNGDDPLFGNLVVIHIGIVRLTKALPQFVLRGIRDLTLQRSPDPPLGVCLLHPLRGAACYGGPSLTESLLQLGHLFGGFDGARLELCVPHTYRYGKQVFNCVGHCCGRLTKKYLL